MASIKQRKSKGRADMPAAAFDKETGAVHWASSFDYAYRKLQFTLLPAAKIVKPVRLIRQRYKRALSHWYAIVARVQPGQPVPDRPSAWPVVWAQNLSGKYSTAVQSLANRA